MLTDNFVSFEQPGPDMHSIPLLIYYAQDIFADISVQSIVSVTIFIRL